MKIEEVESIEAQIVRLDEVEDKLLLLKGNFGWVVYRFTTESWQAETDGFAREVLGLLGLK